MVWNQVQRILFWYKSKKKTFLILIFSVWLSKKIVPLELLKELSKNGASCNGSATDANGPRRRRKSTENKEPDMSAGSEQERDYTPEQVKEVKKLVFCWLI